MTLAPERRTFLVHEYRTALESWIGRGGETELANAYEIGRHFVAHGLGVIEAADIHVVAMGVALPKVARIRGEAQAFQEANRFFAEVLAPFEMALRGFQEANRSLHHLNASLEARVTARTQALMEAQAQYRHLVERTPAIVYTIRLSPEPGITYVSPQLQRILGFSPMDWTLDRWRDRTHPDDRDRVEQAREQARASGQALRLEYRMFSHAEDLVWIQDEAQVLRPDPAREELWLQGIAVDVTERRALEGHVQQLQKMETIGRLAGGVAHDFNNLLAVIMSYGELVSLRLPQEHEVQPDLEEIVKAAERGKRLTRQLLAFARQEVVVPALVQVNDTIRDMERMLRRLLGDELEFELRLGPDLGTTRVDPSQLEQAILNLVVNARDAMPGGGKVVIETAMVCLDAEALDGNRDGQPGEHVMIAVTDTGGGVPEPVRSQIFEPFFTTKARGRGTGLGLSTVFGIVRQNHGHIRVCDASGPGARFELFLPRAEEPPPPPAPRAPAPPRSAMSSKLRILVVEDEGAILRAAERVLRGAGYEVRTAASGEDALALLSQGAFELDLLLVDVVMPGVGGREVAQAVLARWPGARVIYMSGYTDDAEVLRGVMHQQVDFMGKPFTPTQLLGRVAEALGREKSK